MPLPSMLKRGLRRVLPSRTVLHLQAVDHWLNGEADLRVLPAVCSANRVAVDVGANIGIYSYFMRRHAARVVAYEPNPQMARRLARNLPEVDVRCAAVSDRPGRTTLRMPVAGGRAMHELASVEADFEEPEVLSIEVPTVALDDEALGDVGFVKVDVEQHELAVLRGMLGTIARRRPTLLVEVTPLRYGRDLPDAFQFLTDRGYEGWFSYRGKREPFSRFRPDVHADGSRWPHDFMWCNVFFLPHEVDPVRCFGRDALAPGALEASAARRSRRPRQPAGSSSTNADALSS